MDEWVVSKEEAGMKLVAFLKLKKNQHSSRQLKTSLENNHCTINGITERFASVPVYTGDRITLHIDPHLVREKKEGYLLKERILYEDGDILAYDKPAGSSSEELKTEYFLVHRLDRDTTGVLLFAKSKEVFEKMVALFRKQQVHKTYYAIVDRVPKQKKGLIDNFLGKKHAYQGQTIWGSVPQGMRAITEWKLEKMGTKASLLSCHPKTGRTHQLRVHLSELGHPILGDFQYCRQFVSTYPVPRVLLHAYEIEFPHPRKEHPLKITAPFPKDFQKALKDILL